MKQQKGVSPGEQAYWEAYSYYNELNEYINKHDGRFFFNSNEASGSNFFVELDQLLPCLRQLRTAGETYYRARIVKGPTGSYKLPDGPFEAYSVDEFAAPPRECAREGRMNPKGVSYLYLADNRLCALSEIRPAISSIVSIAEGSIHRDVSIASFVSPDWEGISLFEKCMVKIIGNLFSQPLNSQDSNEYIPSQVVAEYIKNNGFDGIEYRSSQYKEGVNLALFDTTVWVAESSMLFEVNDIVYKAKRPRGFVEAFGYKDEEP